MQKRPLIRTVKIFSLIFIFAVLWVFVRSAGPDWSTQNPATSLNLSKVTQGEVVLMEAAGKAFYMIQPDALMLQKLAQLDDHTWSQQPKSLYTNELGKRYLILNAYGPGGCLLRYFSAEDYNSQAGNNLTWFGGLVDLCDRTSFDLSGRQIKTAEYSYHGISSQKSEDLGMPKIKTQVKNKLYLQ